MSDFRLLADGVSIRLLADGTSKRLLSTAPAGPATTVTASGATSGTVDVASNITLGANGTITGTVRVSASIISGSGTLSASFVDINDGDPTNVITITPTALAAVTVRFTNNGGLSNPSDLVFTGTGATATVVTAPAHVIVGVAIPVVFSANDTLPISGILVTPSDAASGTFSSSSFTLSAGTPSVEVNYTAPTAGTKTITASNDAGITAGTDSILADTALLTNGCWSWFSRPVGLYASGALGFGSITTAGSPRIGKYLDSTGVITTLNMFTTMEADDHDIPALLLLADGRMACFYSKHGVDDLLRYRVSTNDWPDISAFDAEATVTIAKNTYANPVHVSGHASPHWVITRSGTDAALPFQWGYVAFANDLSSAGTYVPFVEGVTDKRPYLVCVSNGVDRVDFLMTDEIPNAGQSSVYHFYMELVTGTPHWYKTDGTEILTALPLTAADWTLVSDGSTVRRWIWDIVIDPVTGYPVCLGTRYPDNDGSDIRYMCWYWTGSAWGETEITAGGTALYAGQPFYAGGLCFDSTNPGIVYLSKEVSGVHEMQKWATSDDYASFAKTQDITSGSTTHNARPMSPKDHGDVSLVWWKEATLDSYETYEVYNTNVMGIGAAPPEAPTIGVATATGSTTATVSYTAAGSGPTPEGYVATSTPGSITGTLLQAGSGTITVTGLSPGTSYTFTVHAFNDNGDSTESAASNSITTTEASATSGGTATRRRRARIILRVDGQEYEVADLAKALEIIKAAKAEVPQVAEQTAQQIVATGKRIGDAKRAESAAIQVVEAPSSVRSIIEDRIAEMQRLHWRLVQARLREMEDDEDVMAVL